MLLREIAINVAAMTPPGRMCLRRYLTRKGYDADKDLPEYINGVFDKHWKALGQPTKGAVLEVGPGGNVAVSRQFAHAGCGPVVAIDVVPYVGEPEGVEYRAPEMIETTPVPDSSFDYIYSHACLEHVRHPDRTTDRMVALLRPGGKMSHVIDLRDHRNFDRPHDFLKLPQWLWRLAGSHRGWPNRWRASDWINALEGYGLTVSLIREERAPLPPRLRRNKRFADKSRDDLEIVGIHLVATRP